MDKDKKREARLAWVYWLSTYGAGSFFDSFVATAQGALSQCVQCGQDIALDIVEGGGIPDWGATREGSTGLDYGCAYSPETNDEGTGGHVPRKKEEEG